MDSAVIAKAEELIWNNSGTTSFIPRMIYASCQMFSRKFFLMSLFIFILDLADKTISVLLILIIGFFLSLTLCYYYLYMFLIIYLKKNGCIRD